MLTLPETEALSFTVLFANLPPLTANRIGAMALEAEFLQLVAEDGGLHASHEDILKAERLYERTTARLKREIWTAFPKLLPEEPSGVYPIGMVLDGHEPPRTINVRGLGVRQLCRTDWAWWVPDGGRLVAIGGAIDLNGANPAAPHDWLFLSVDDIAAERERLHPELAAGAAAETNSEEARNARAA